MIRTEKEWKELWCPHTRTIAQGVVQLQGPSGQRVAAPVSATVNRLEPALDNKQGIPTQCRCIASACGAWEETEPAQHVSMDMPSLERQKLISESDTLPTEAKGYCLDLMGRKRPQSKHLGSSTPNQDRA